MKRILVVAAMVAMVAGPAQSQPVVREFTGIQALFGPGTFTDDGVAVSYAGVLEVNGFPLPYIAQRPAGTATVDLFVALGCAFNTSACLYTPIVVGQTGTMIPLNTVVPGLPLGVLATAGNASLELTYRGADGAILRRATFGRTLTAPPVSTVPEPSTYVMLGTGLLALGGVAVRKRRV